MSKRGTYMNYLDRYSEDPVPRTTNYRQRITDRNNTVNLQFNKDMCNAPKENMTEETVRHKISFIIMRVN